jgi:hypothetical protein
MALMRKTTTTTAAAFKRTSMRSRPATQGNKNVNGRARRKDAMGQSARAVVKRGGVVGPYLGS